MLHQLCSRCNLVAFILYTVQYVFPPQTYCTGTSVSGGSRFCSFRWRWMIGWRGEEVELVMLIRALEKKVEVEMEVKVVFKLEVKATVSRIFYHFLL